MRSMTPDPAPFPLDGFTPSELSALRNDGSVVAIAPGRYRILDEPDCAETRARALAADWSPAARDRLVIAGLSAAWVHGAALAPPRVDQALLRPGKRFRVVGTGRMHLSERTIDVDQVQRRGGVRVLSPAATAIDLALRLEALSPMHAASLGVVRGRADDTMALAELLCADRVDQAELRQLLGGLSAKRHVQLLATFSACRAGRANAHPRAGAGADAGRSSVSAEAGRSGAGVEDAVSVGRGREADDVSPADTGATRATTRCGAAAGSTRTRRITPSEAA